MLEKIARTSASRATTSSPRTQTMQPEPLCEDREDDDERVGHECLSHLAVAAGVTATLWALQRVFGEPPVRIRTSAAPCHRAFIDALGSGDLVPIVNFDNNQHGENENCGSAISSAALRSSRGIADVGLGTRGSGLGFFKRSVRV